MEDNYLINMEGVTVHYPDREHGGRKVVLNDVGLHVRSGEFITVVGPSGCGKSTLLRLVLGSQFANEGTVLVDGEHVSEVNRQRGIVYQKYSLFDNLTVLENIALGGILEETSIPDRVLAAPLFILPKGLRRKVPLPYFKASNQWMAKAVEILKRIGLSETDGRKYPHELSGGMRQRVAIGQALIMKPKILLMDEPFGALDHSTREDMQLFILEQWQQYGMTIFFVTHDLGEAVFLGSRLIGLSQFYKNGDGTRGHGAKIVSDIAVPGPHPRPNSFKSSPEFNRLVRSLEEKVLSPEHLQHIHEFDRTHADSLHEATTAIKEAFSDKT